MKLLLDTHTFLWYISGDSRLPPRHHAAICDPANEAWLSVASIWEAVIKYALGRLSLPAPAANYLPQQRQAHGIASLAISEGALAYLANLPPLHRDPFDRMLIAQALEHSLILVTSDRSLLAYAAPFF